MTHARIPLLRMFVIMTLGAAPATKPARLHDSAEVALRFHAALKANDTEAAHREIATSPKPLADQSRRLTRLAARFKDEVTPFAVFDVRAEGDVAVAIVGYATKGKSATFDSEEWYLIRQAGTWRVLPNPREFDLPEYNFDEPRLNAYRKLEEWMTKRTAELKKEITGCDC